MSFRIHFSLLLVLVARAFAQATGPLPLQDGERLTYRVSWAILPGAGEIKVSAQEQSVFGARQLVVTSTTTTRGFAKALMPFSADAKSTFDLKSGRLMLIHENSVLRAKRSEHTMSFDYDARQAYYTPLREGKNKAAMLPMPPGDPMDLIMALLQTRSWNIKPGEKRDALVVWDDEFYELTLHATGYEEVKTSLGTFNTLVIEPRMDKTPPKGMFRKGSTVRVWIAQDAHRLPVKFSVEFKIGTGTATLDSYQPAANATQGAGPTAAPRDGKNPRP